MSIKRFRSLSVPTRAAALASVAAVAVWSAVWIKPNVDEPKSFPEVPPSSVEAARQTHQGPAEAAQQPSGEAAQQPPAHAKTQPAAKAAQPLAAAEKQAPAHEHHPRSELRHALASDNAGVRIGALRTVAELRTVEALPELLAIDVTRDPELAPTLFQVTGRLAQHADASQRTAAVSQLSRWLQSESVRSGADARGNVSVLVETLADFQAPEAESALIQVLQSDQQPLHVQTLAVEGLAKLGTPAAQAALTEFRTKLGLRERQGFELELQREAEQAADRALAKLSK